MKGTRLQGGHFTFFSVHPIVGSLLDYKRGDPRHRKGELPPPQKKAIAQGQVLGECILRFRYNQIYRQAVYPEIQIQPNIQTSRT